ncbi:hypothetical protein VP01_2238g1 [Puccinia sorghi]|uniref:Uncharacterized protein n=1 Tax=Puccinia sorghi TaxID=27349 RepID=A0A0L6V983_9BASI|nr:hypothetical protein VP01_2238g1 [Puccinia sorghi]
MLYIIKLIPPLGYSSKHSNLKPIYKGFVVELKRISTELGAKFTKNQAKLYMTKLRESTCMQLTWKQPWCMQVHTRLHSNIRSSTQGSPAFIAFCMECWVETCGQQSNNMCVSARVAQSFTKLLGSFCCYSNLSPRVIQSSFDAQSLGHNLSSLDTKASSMVEKNKEMRSISKHSNFQQSLCILHSDCAKPSTTTKVFGSLASKRHSGAQTKPSASRNGGASTRAPTMLVASNQHTDTHGVHMQTGGVWMTAWLEHAARQLLAVDQISPSNTKLEEPLVSSSSSSVFPCKCQNSDLSTLSYFPPHFLPHPHPTQPLPFFPVTNPCSLFIPIPVALQYLLLVLSQCSCPCHLFFHVHVHSLGLLWILHGGSPVSEHFSTENLFLVTPQETCSSFTHFDLSSESDSKGVVVVFQSTILSALVTTSSSNRLGIVIVQVSTKLAVYGHQKLCLNSLIISITSACGGIYGHYLMSLVICVACKASKGLRPVLCGGYIGAPISEGSC